MYLVNLIAKRLEKTKFADALTKRLTSAGVAEVSALLGSSAEGVTVSIISSWLLGEGERNDITIRAAATAGAVHAKITATTKQDSAVVVINEGGNMASAHVGLADLIAAAGVGDVLPLLGSLRRWPADTNAALLLAASRLLGAVGEKTEVAAVEAVTEEKPAKRR